jgi:hypothetical protein
MTDIVQAFVEFVCYAIGRWILKSFGMKEEPLDLVAILTGLLALIVAVFLVVTVIRAAY